MLFLRQQGGHVVQRFARAVAVVAVFVDQPLFDRGNLGAQQSAARAGRQAMQIVRIELQTQGDRKESDTLLDHVLDQGLARELLAAGRPAWQVLAGAIPGKAPATEILYADDPFGVFYLVAWLAGPDRADGSSSR